ncbi:MAG: 7,8-dihydro-8-oxoguanine triphosphatase [Parcubacteria group bacterium Gr01-1014_33]|nr:MAG: 7,8-dihydro-8-oxoguanine triphosphatase [Parcubacteria group bacterium Gr01-1014_33]
MIMNEDIFHLGIKAVIRNKDGEILLLKVNPAKLKGWDGEPYWDIPGGRIKRGDTIEETLTREVEEETGITSIASFTPFMLALSPLRIPIKDSDVGLILSIYICEIDPREEIRLSKEHTEYMWTSLAKAAHLLSFKYPAECTEKVRGLD